MFDWIIFEMKCPKCKTKMDSFQSKSGGCSMEHLEFWEVTNFYSGCSKCTTWVEFDIARSPRPNRKLTMRDYKKTIKISTTKQEREHRQRYKEIAKRLKGGANE